MDPLDARIDPRVLDKMFHRVGITRAALYRALREMGRENLRRDLRNDWTPEYPTRNYCYVVAEYVHEFLAPDGSTAWRLAVPGDPAEHWFNRLPDGTLIDLAAEQFPRYADQVQYQNAKRSTFLLSPSRRARTLASLIAAAQRAPRKGGH